MSTVSRGFDTWTVNACSCFVVGGWNVLGLDVDSAQAFTTLPVDNVGAAGVDTLARFTIIPPSALSAVYNPAVYFKWYLSDGRVIRDDKPMVHMTSYVDYLRTAVAAVATVNYDTLASIVNDTLSLRHPGDWAATGSGGTGAFPESVFVYDQTSSGIVTGAIVHIKTTDTSNYQNSSGPQPTGVTGSAIFSLDAGTFPVAVSAQGYFTSTAYQLVTQTAPGGRDTVFMFSYVFTPPVGSDSCLLVIYTDVPYAEGLFKIDQPQKAPLRGSTGVYIDKNEFSRTADANGVIQAALVVGSATTPSCTYHILVKNTKGKELAEWNNYMVPDSTTATLMAIE